MTEKEKMLSGQWYDSRDPELLERYHLARDIMSRLNHLHGKESLAEKGELLGRLLGSIGKEVWVETPFYCDYGANIFIGDGTFIHMNAMFIDNHFIRIGKHVLIGPGVQLLTAIHPLRAEERISELRNQPGEGAAYRTFSKPITIGDACWIGANSLILPGVTLGKKVTIGAGSVVTKDIPDSVLAVGNPARVIRKLD